MVQSICGGVDRLVGNPRLGIPSLEKRAVLEVVYLVDSSWF